MTPQQKPTRRETLLECLEYMEKKRNAASKDGRGLCPKDRDAEDLFYELSEKTRVIREVIQDYENPDVVIASANWRNPAKWQREFMKDPETAIRHAMDFTIQ